MPSKGTQVAREQWQHSKNLKVHETFGGNLRAQPPNSSSDAWVSINLWRELTPIQKPRVLKKVFHWTPEQGCAFLFTLIFLLPLLPQGSISTSWMNGWMNELISRCSAQFMWLEVQSSYEGGWQQCAWDTASATRPASALLKVGALWTWDGWESSRLRGPWHGEMTLSSVLSVRAQWQLSSVAMTYYIPE